MEDLDAKISLPRLSLSNLDAPRCPRACEFHLDLTDRLNLEALGRRVSPAFSRAAVVYVPRVDTAPCRKAMKAWGFWGEP